MKLFCSLVIAASELSIVAGWIVVVHALPPDLHPHHTLGIHLNELSRAHMISYHALVIIHAAAMVLMLLVAYTLFRKTSVRRRIKSFILCLGIGLTLADLLAWSLSQYGNELSAVVGPFGFATSAVLMVLGMVPVWQMWVYTRWRNHSGRTIQILVIGGGFAGLYVALTLNKLLGYHKDLELTLVDQNNYFLFVPLLPSASVGTIELSELSFPYRQVFETTNVMFRKLRICSIDMTRRAATGKQTLEGSENAQDNATVQLPYDYLVVSPGSLGQSCDIEGVAHHAFFMKTLQDAFLLRNHIINCFETAATIGDPHAIKQLLTFVIVGGGATGVEAATEIHDLIFSVLLKRYPEVDSGAPSILIIQGGEHILPDWNSDVVQLTTNRLAAMNIELILGKRVSRVQPDFVEINNSERIACSTAVWCSGTKAHPLLATLGIPVEKSGRVPINADLSVPQDARVYVLGDAAHLINGKTQQPLPPLAQVAVQQGIHCGKNIARDICGKAKLPFSYFDYGALVSIGERNAVVKLCGLTCTGFLGWLIWRILYVCKLVGWGNRIRVLLDWTLDLLIERSITQIELIRSVEYKSD